MASQQEPFISNRSHLHPEAPFVQEQLIGCYPKIACAYYNPAGGERFGTCSVASLVDTQYSLDQALLALWKISLCTWEGFPYQDWDSKQVSSMLKYYYLEQYNSWTKPKQSQDFCKWLQTQALECIQAMYKLAKPLNPPSFLCDTQPTGNKQPNNEWKQQLENLEFATPGSLQATLASTWNNSEGLFYNNKHWYLLSWGTSA